MSSAASISMPSMTARKSALLSANRSIARARPANSAGARPRIERVDGLAPLRQAGEPRRDAARRCRRCRRPRGRTNRSRTWPRAARGRGCAWRGRTSCRRARLAAPARSPLSGTASVMASGTARPARCATGAAAGRARPCRRRAPNSPVCSECTGSLNGSRLCRIATRRSASLWMTATSSASRVSWMLSEKPRLCLSSPAVRATTSRRQYRKGGGARLSPSMSTPAPCMANRSSGI